MSETLAKIVAVLTKICNLFVDVPVRVPGSFFPPILTSQETNQHQLENVLQPSDNGYTSGNTDAERIQENAQHASIDTGTLRINVKAANKFFDQDQHYLPVYSTSSKNRGIVLIINVINYINDVQSKRLGAEVDGRNLEELFTQMGLKVYAYVDLTREKIEEAITSFKSAPEISTVDMIFVIVMGHGEEFLNATYVIGSDNRKIRTEWIEEQFDNANCKPLQKKPKIFMYQTCRGRLPDYGVSQNIQIDSGRGRLRTREDMLVAHSTLLGYASHRDIYHGTWFIQKFCESMMDHACDKQIEDVFKLVDIKISQLKTDEDTKQTSMYSNEGFNKLCYIHPKIYLDNGVMKFISDDAIVA